MKSGYLLALLCLLPTLASADIYKSVNADGHITYSNTPSRGSKRISESPPRPPVSHTRSAGSPADFPKVNQETQKGRDQTRRKILEDELNNEQGLLTEAKQNLKVAQADPKLAKDARKMNQLSAQVELHQRNIDALNTEISRVK
ncbi:MAG: DUF4124 domain-containing protein [Gallionella sp.]|nr:DUF4124 domain-containing protein [Gallionella sp.]MDD4945345.1 DUF4124 domain-containing protein [Gallionella sp.]MDD5611754.1 DUF4124 domain-containing protein [Gallionella sp.]